MRRITHFPHELREIENVWIPLSDGTRLAARIWMPTSAETTPVPAILEYIPYRKRDFTRGRDEPMHAYFAGHGYAAVRVDLRGSGDSDGLLMDEYLPQEQDDAVEVIAWIAAQPWCSGFVGMMGISWGGFNALQVAARQPPALRAIITLCSTDDRYADDAHYMGGCVLNENMTWGSVLLAFQALPPDPAIVGQNRWREMWHTRLNNLRLFPAEWLRHQRRDAYWAQGSVCEDYARIQVPVYAVGGWADGYTNAVPRLLTGLSVPRKGLIGPWAHAFPHDARPGPSIGFLQEALRWWNHWLKGVDTGIMDEPPLRVWMQESVAPQPTYQERPGRWVAEVAWPSDRIEMRHFHLNAHGLSETPEAGEAPEVRSPPRTGIASGDWCAFGALGEMPTDQREDDGRSLVFDSLPLDEPMEILGAPLVELDLVCDRPTAMVAVRLNDIAPGGASTRVTYGLLNLTHRDSHAQPTALEPGRALRVRVQLNDIAHAFPRGHRIRVAISTGYWPIAWPSPESATLRICTGTSTLLLPVRPLRTEDALLRPFEEPESAPAPHHNVLRPVAYRRTLERDLARNETVYTIFSDGGDYDGAAIAQLPSIGLELGHTILRRFRVHQNKPCTAGAEIEQKTLLRRGSWEIRVQVDTTMTCSEDTFFVRGLLIAQEGGKEVFRHTWDEQVPRDLV